MRMPTVQPTASTPTPLGAPDIKISVRQTFGIDSDLEVPGFSQPSEHVPDMDDAYRFDHDTTLAILAADHHPAVEGEAGEDGEPRAGGEAKGTIHIGPVPARRR